MNFILLYCNNIYKHVDYYKFFNIIDNKYVCVKNNVEPKRYYLNGYNITPWYESLNGEYSEWIIENISDNRISIAKFILKFITASTYKLH